MQAARTTPTAPPGRIGTRSLVVFSFAIAAGWWALAGSNATNAGDLQASPVRVGTPAERPPTGVAHASQADRSSGSMPAAGVDAFPYAAGGDDLLALPEPAAPSHRDEATPTHDAAPAVAATADRSTGSGALRLAATRSASAPTLLAWFERERAAPGETVRLHIATALASRCRVEGLVHGDITPNGTLSVVAGEPGIHRLRVTCGGDGGVVARDVTLRVPLPAYPDSATNHRLAAAAGMPWTRIDELPAAAREALAQDIGPGPVTIADFFQEGQYAIFAAGAHAGALETRFIAVDDAGRWIDRSAELRGAGDIGAACTDPTVALSADLNHDGKPDIWLDCGRCDAQPDGDGCRPLLVLSQADGRYRAVPADRATAAARAPLPGRSDDSRVEAVATAAGSR